MYDLTDFQLFEIHLDENDPWDLSFMISIKSLNLVGGLVRHETFQVFCDSKLLDHTWKIARDGGFTQWVHNRATREGQPWETDWDLIFWTLDHFLVQFIWDALLTRGNL